jgi:predicted RNA binding protein YcfA (HicA-like mRNA interferase family)
MSEKLPRIPANKIITLLIRKGFRCVRQSGSHKIFKNDSGTRVTVPDHVGKILHPKIVKQICKDADINPDELV